ncbi:MAG: PAS domain S-box protein [Bacteroidota bacterium]
MLKAIFDNAIDGIITINDRGTIESINPAAAKMFGYSNEEVAGKNVNMLMPEPYHSNHDGYMKRYAETGEKRIIGSGREVLGKRKDNSTFPFFLSISEVHVDNRKIFAGIIHDITELKKAEENIREYASKLEHSNAELQNFAYVSSHDLQEPLRKIQAFGDRLLLKELENLSPDGQDYLHRILKAASRMQQLINDLLKLSRVASQEAPLVPVSLNEILMAVKEDLDVQIEKANAKIVSSELPVILADPTQMRQLFQNLIGNSLKFAKEGVTPEIKILYDIFETENEKYIRLIFTDNGIGFEEKFAEKIFTVFQRLNGQKYDGSGIGLAICKKIVSQLNGSIEAKSEPDKGAQFIITLSQNTIQNNIIT